MIIRQFLHQEPVGISYLFGCGGRAAGAVVDPVGEIEPYMRAAEAVGMRIHFVIDTHVHADHLSAGRQLAKNVLRVSPPLVLTREQAAEGIAVMREAFAEAA